MNKLKKSRLAMSLVVLCAFSLFAQNTWYVDASRPNDDGPGDSLETAWQIIQTAMESPGLEDGDTILVAPGIYDQGGSRQYAGDALNRVRFIKSDIHLMATSTNPADTVIVGAPDPDRELGTGTNAVRGVFMHYGAQLTGFTVTGGHSGADNRNWDRGGGIVTMDENCVVSNCVLIANIAHTRGGGIAARRDMPRGRVYNSVIKNNFVPGNSGGGVIGQIVVNSIIKNNTNHHPTASGTVSSFGGGAASSILINCRLEGNVASSGGASPRLCGSAAANSTLINCLVTENILPGGSWISGALYDCITINSTIVGNIDARNRSAVGGYNSEVYNTVIWGNYRDGVYNNNLPSVPSVIEYSCAPELDHGVNGNITNNPVFIDEPVRNLRPTGPARASPAINAGNNTFILDLLADYPEAAFDMDGNPRIIEDIVDMGAYEYKPPPPGCMLSFF